MKFVKKGCQTVILNYNKYLEKYTGIDQVKSLMSKVKGIINSADFRLYCMGVDCACGDTVKKKTG